MFARARTDSLASTSTSTSMTATLTSRAARAVERRHSRPRRVSRTPVALWNPFMNVPNRVEGKQLSKDERERADDSDGVMGADDCARSIRSASSLSRGISRPDEYFEDMGLRFEFDETNGERSLDDLNKLFVAVGFTRRSDEALVKAIDNSHVSLWVVATRDSRFAKVGQTVAFARVTSDGVFTATIWDVAVSPVWQRHGIGRGMVERLVERMLDEDICNVALYAEKKVLGLYEDLGFKQDPNGQRAMSWRADSQPY